MRTHQRRRPASRLDFAGYVEQSGEHLAFKTAELYRLAAMHFRKFLPEGISLAAVDRLTLERFKAYLLKRMSHNGAASYFNRLRAALRHAVEDGLIFLNPAAKVRALASLPSRREHLTLEEVKRLASVPRWRNRNERARLAFLFQCFTGLRFSDVATLRWTQVRSGKLSLQMKKTSRLLELTLCDEAVKILEASRAFGTEGKVFELPCLVNFNKMLGVWRRRALLSKPLTSHIGRHTFATLALNAGVRLEVVQECLGHQSPVTTKIYARLSDSTITDAMKMMPTL